MIVTAKLEVNR